VVSAALALVLGGALGNLWDRLTLGHVVDFVLLHAGRYAWPAFNVADSAITVGVVVLVWESVWPRGRPRRIEREEA
jgi:signal peptidase II